MKRSAILLAVLLMPILVKAQTGLPPFGSFSSTAFDTINNQNLNVNFRIPIVSSAGRGMPLNLTLTNNSLLWHRVNSTWTPINDSAGNPTWGWHKDFPTGGFVTYKTSTNDPKCEPGGQIVTTTTYNNFVYVDVLGTKHPFAISYTVSDQCSVYNSGSTTGYAVDPTGYWMDASDPDNPIVKNNNGLIPLNGTGNAMDVNGNFISKTIVSSTETDWKDSVGNTALKIVYSPTQTNPTSIQYSFLDGSGAYHTITLQLTGYNVKTNFGCAGVGEYTSTGMINLPSELDIPTPAGGTLKYIFTYEATPSNPTYVTGRVKKVTLPTGGTYEYDYGTTNDGANCSDGTTVNMSRVVTNGGDSGTWNFVRNATSATTTVTTPALPDTSGAYDTVYTFNGANESTRQIYGYSPHSGTPPPLRTVYTNWAGGTPFSIVTVLDDGTTSSETDPSFDLNGNLQSLTEYDWGTPTHGPLIRTTTYSYQGGTNYTNQNLISLVTSKVVKDSTGTVQYRQDTTYDGTALTCPAGEVQHDDASYPCSSNYRGNPTSITTYTSPAVPSGGITKNFTYDWFGNLLTADLNCCQKKTWNYSATTKHSQPDSVTSGTSPTQLTTSATYNAYTGQIATSTDENNQVTSYSYDFLRRPIKVTQPDSTQILQTYDDTAFTSTVTTPFDSGRSVQQITAVDNLGYAKLSTIEDGSSTVYSITQTLNDLLGRAYKTSNPYTSAASEWTAGNFDALGRPTSTILQDSSTTTVTYSANTAIVTDPASKKRKSVTDAAGRLTKVFESDNTSGNNLTVETDYTYNVLDELLTAADSPVTQTRTYQYDSLGRLTDRAEPETKNAGGQGHYQYQYNNYDLVTQRTDPRGVITTYGYDTLNRLHTITYNVGSAGVAATAGVTLTYGATPTSNNNGRLITMADGAGSEGYTYDILGRMTQLQKIIGGTVYNTSYLYNVGNELTQITYPSGRVVQQAVDPVGRLCAIAQTASSCTTGTNLYASNYNYNNPASQLQGFNYGNGVTAALGYSSDRLQLTSLAYTKGATTLFSLAYAYGAAGSNNGQITKITDNVDNGRTLTLAYDKLARISTAGTAGSTGYPAWGLSWTYDRYGNRNAQAVTAGTAPASSATAVTSTNRLPSPYVYDANGNMTNDGSNTLTYDGENRAITSSGGLGSGTYTYDGNNFRVKKVSGSTTTVYVFSGSSVIAEYVNGVAPASPTREYIYSGSTLLAKIESGSTQYYHSDHLSARLMTDSTGTKIGEQGHYPFGESWYASSTTTKWQFTSYERDAESGNDYAYARFYANRLSRFGAADAAPGSAANPQSLNRYDYVTDDPENGTDPLGLCPNWNGIPFAPQGKVICTSAEARGDEDIIGGVMFISLGPATWQKTYDGYLLAEGGNITGILFMPIYGPSQQMATNSGLNGRMHAALQARLTNFAKSNCAKVFGATIPGFSVAALTASAMSMNFYNASTTPDSNLTQNQVVGNGNSTTLANTVGYGGYAQTIWGRRGTAAVLGANFLSDTAPTLGDNVLHEALHGYLRRGDDFLFSIFGQNGLTRDPNNPESTAPISNWLNNDCKKK